jgi:hypothetical protein
MSGQQKFTRGRSVCISNQQIFADVMIANSEGWGTHKLTH